MKKQFLTIILFAILSVSFFSCKKDSTTGTSATYYMKGKKDGVAFNFTTNAQATTLDAGSGIKLFSLLAWGTGSEGFNLGINFFNGTAITTGSYSENYAGLNYVVGGVYNPNSTTTVYSAGIQSPTAKPLVINILTKTSTEITGTFEALSTGRI